MQPLLDSVLGPEQQNSLPIHHNEQDMDLEECSVAMMADSNALAELEDDEDAVGSCSGQEQQEANVNGNEDGILPPTCNNNATHGNNEDELFEALMSEDIPEDDGDNAEANLENNRSLRKALRLILAGKNMSSIAVVMGTSQYTVSQYRTFRIFGNWFDRGGKPIPSYNTILYSLYPALLKHCFVPHLIIHEILNIRAAGVTATRRQDVNMHGTALEPVLITFPSSWLHRGATSFFDAVLAESEKLQSPKVCNFLDSYWERYDDYLNGGSVFSETDVKNSLFLYGSYIFKNDVLVVRCTVRNKPDQIRLH